MDKLNISSKDYSDTHLRLFRYTVSEDLKVLLRIVGKQIATS